MSNLEFKDVYLYPGHEASLPKEPWYATHLVKHSGGKKYRVYAREMEPEELTYKKGEDPDIGKHDHQTYGIHVGEWGNKSEV